jgi:hypothetical protein
MDMEKRNISENGSDLFTAPTTKSADRKNGKSQATKPQAEVIPVPVVARPAEYSYSEN